MLLKKNNREIRFLQLTLQQKIKNPREEAHEFQAPIDERDPLEACMLQLQQKYVEDPKNLSCLRNKDKLRHAIRSFSFDEEGRLLTILWGVGDKDTTNPSIWNDSTDLSRTVEVADDERVACTGHMVLSLAYMPQLRGYMACMEEIQQLGASNLENVLNNFSDSISLYKDRMRLIRTRHILLLFALKFPRWLHGTSKRLCGAVGPLLSLRKQLELPADLMKNLREQKKNTVCSRPTEVRRSPNLKRGFAVSIKSGVLKDTPSSTKSLIKHSDPYP